MQLVLKGYSLAIRDAFRFEKKYLEFSVFPLYFGQIVIKNRRYKKGPKSYILAKHEKKKTTDLSYGAGDIVGWFIEVAGKKTKKHRNLHVVEVL